MSEQDFRQSYIDSGLRKVSPEFYESIKFMYNYFKQLYEKAEEARKAISMKNPFSN